MPLLGLLRNFVLKVGAISRGRYEQRIRELAEGNTMLEAATGPILRARVVSDEGCAEVSTTQKALRQKPPSSGT